MTQSLFKFLPFPDRSVVDKTVACLMSDKLLDLRVLGEVCEILPSALHQKSMLICCVWKSAKVAGKNQ